MQKAKFLFIPIVFSVLLSEDNQTAFNEGTPINHISLTSEENLNKNARETFENSDMVTLSRDGETVSVFSYTGSSQSFTVPEGVSSLNLELWGAQGGTGHYQYEVDGGKGGYARGSLNVNPGDVFYIYVGEKPTCTDDNRQGGGGGGASDIRYNNGDGSWENFTGLHSRIIVAGGGSGTHGGSYSTSQLGAGGGLEGTVSYYRNLPSCTPASQTSGGVDNSNANGIYSQYEQDGFFGYAGYALDTPNNFNDSFGGWNGGGKGNRWVVGGGGGGWYGGATVWPQGGGGSGYVLTTDSYRPNDYNPPAIYELFGTELIAGDQEMPSPDGSLMTGNSGHGLVIITYSIEEIAEPDPITSLDIDGESGWQLFSSPVEGAILSDLLDELWTQGSINSDLYWGDPNVFTYDEGWNPVMDLNTHVLSAGQGIAVYVFSDTDDDGEDDLPVTIGLDDGFTDYEEAVTISTNESSYNLLGNPYAFSVDIAQLSSDNPNYGSSVYVWDRSISSYRVHNGTTGDIADGLLAPFQGFWVQSNAEGNNYSFSEESISNDQGTNYRTTDNESNGSAVFTFSTGEFSSSVFLSFTPEGEINLDPSDAHRFVPMEPSTHLTSMVYESTKSLAINNLPLEMNTDITLDMDVMMLEPSDTGYETQQSQVHMSWDMSNLPEGINVALQNNVTGYMVNLDGSAMNLTLLSKGGFELNDDLMETYPEVGESQFTLIITTDFASSDDDELTTANNFKLHSAYPNPFNPSTKIRFDLTEVDMVSMDVFDISGRQVATLINEIMIPGSHEVNWNPGELSSGVYLIKLNAGENSMNQKVTYIK